MEKLTPEAEGIRFTERKAQYDAACKRVLSEKIFLAWIMKSCLEEYKEYDVREIAAKYIEGQPQVGEVAVGVDETNSRIRGMNGEDSSLTEGTVTYDIRFFSIVPSSGEFIRLIINVEAQGKFHVGYPITKRGIYYCCRMISAQYGTEFTDSRYQNIKKVYSIWIVMNPPKKRENSITRYRIIEENVVGSEKESIKNYDLLSMIMICLGDAGQTESDILQLLDVLLTNEIASEEKQRILEKSFDIPMTKTLEGGLNSMCNLSDYVEEKAMARGMARGMKKGMEKGMEKGIEKGRMENMVNNIKNLTETLGLSLEAAMAALKVPEEEQDNYAKLLRNQ